MTARRMIAALTATCFLCLGMQTAVAGVISTRDALMLSQRAESLQKIERALASEQVRDELVALGVDPADAVVRVASLSDAELAAIATDLDNLPAGGDSVLAVIGIVFVVLFILEITGVTDIFKRV